MKITLFESFGPIVASRNVPFICLWVRNPACTLQAWMGDNRESKLRPKKHCKTSPFLPFCKSYTKYRKMCSFCHIGNIWQYFAMLGNIFNLPHINCVISKNFVYILHEVFFALSILQVYIPGVLLIICYLSAYLLTFLPNVLQKGQTKSKWFFQADVSSKKWTNKFDFTTCWLVLFVFWKKVKAPKRHFEINWPLVCTSQ